MNLTAGDFFAGSYQLREPAAAVDAAGRSVLRWRADDYSANRQEEVVLDVLPCAYDEALFWLAEVPGLRKVGQSASPAARYFAWEPPKVQSVIPFDYRAANPAERRSLAELIMQLHIAAHETISTDDMPEFWRSEQEGWVVFYRKHTGQATSYKEKQAVRQAWIENLSRPAEASIADPIDEPVYPSVPARSPRWTMLLVGVGILLLAWFYFKLPKVSPHSRGMYDQAVERGIDHVKKGEFDSAVESFNVAASAPPSDELDSRLDSLAQSYQALARRECERYRSTGSNNLYFIPNQYFQYTAILSRQPKPEVCE